MNKKLNRGGVPSLETKKQTNSKKTKRTLIASLFSMVLCMAMFAGTTFAWFTDNKSVAVSTVESGTLGIALQDSQGTAIGTELTFQKPSEVTEDVLWEPGATYYLPAFKIVNTGNLWLKYQVTIEGVEGSDNQLLNAIDFYVLEDYTAETYAPDLTNATKLTDYFAEGTEAKTLAPKDSETGASTKMLTIIGHMKETAGNEYQGLKLEGVKINVVATQYTKEYDSYSDQYDKEAKYPVITTADDGTTNSLSAAIASVDNYGVGIITVTSTGNKGKDEITINGNKNITLNLEKGSVVTPTNTYGVSVKNGSTLTLTGSGSIGDGKYGINVSNSGTLNINSDVVISGGNLLTEGAVSNSGSPQGTLNISAGIFSSGNVAVKNSGGKAYISGGTFTSTGTSYSSCSAITTNGSTGYTEITGGTFTGPSAIDNLRGTTIVKDGTFSGVISVSEGTLTIEGGTFTNVSKLNVSGGTLEIKGGMFTVTSSVSDYTFKKYVASGYTATKNGDTWTVTAE